MRTGPRSLNSMHSFRIPAALFLVMSVVLARPAPAVAQESAASTSSRFCFRPDGSGCDWFPITEFGVALASGGSGGANGRIWNLGLMRNVGERTAIGAMVTFTDEASTTVTLSPVGRIRLSRDFALDLAPGVVMSGRQFKSFPSEQPSPDSLVETFATGLAPGFAFDASVTYRDWGAVFVRTSILPYDEVSRATYSRIDLPGGGTSWLSHEPESVARSGTVTETWVGVRAGSYPGLGLGVLAVIVTVIANAVTEN
jgi:hypothetical protein